ncbi:MAG: hypothetical protein IPK67_18730 [Planctomycetes bacterium]|nr:hypothetical protein [Planctomycetota bacterium]
MDRLELGARELRERLRGRGRLVALLVLVAGARAARDRRERVSSAAGCVGRSSFGPFTGTRSKGWTASTRSRSRRVAFVRSTAVRSRSPSSTHSPSRQSTPVLAEGLKRKQESTFTASPIVTALGLPASKTTSCSGRP